MFDKAKDYAKRIMQEWLYSDKDIKGFEEVLKLTCKANDVEYNLDVAKGFKLGMIFLMAGDKIANDDKTFKKGTGIALIMLDMLIEKREGEKENAKS